MKKLPKQARAKARVQKILDVTQDLLLLKGVDGVTTTAISQKSVIPVGSVYQYFEDKEEILSTLYVHAFEDIRVVIEQTVSQFDGNIQLPELVNVFLQTFWHEAWQHPSYRALTRWANAQRGFWDETLDESSHVTNLMRFAFKTSGLSYPQERFETVLKLCTTVISVIIDLAIEQESETEAQKLINELEIMILAYVSSQPYPD